MRHRLPPLDGLKVFESAARHLSFTRAADELCVSKGAVSYQIRRLEEHVGRALFTRAVRQVALTEAGHELQETTQRLFAELATTLAHLNPQHSVPDVIVAATTYVAARWLSPRIAQFVADHPDTSVVLQHNVNTADFALDDVDIAILWDRCHRITQRHRILELPMSLFPVCNRSLRAALGPRPKPDALIRVPLLCEDRTKDLWQEWADVAGTRLHNPRRVIADANVRVQAAIDGQGFVMADELMSRELDSGVLVAPFDIKLTGYGYVVMHSPARRSPAAANDLLEWLCTSEDEPALSKAT